MLWCEAARNIGLSKRKLKSALGAAYDHNARPSPQRTDIRTDSQTDGRTSWQ